MRLNKKQMVLELLETVEEGIHYSMQANSGEGEIILNDCIEAFTSILNIIDNEEAVNLIREINIILNSYVNLIISNDLNKVDLNQVIEKINNLRELIVRKIKTEVEIAFMPYKAAMWDSLESVYEAAKEDSDCTSYVIPIPYYELDNKGTDKKLCCERFNFPTEIDTINYLNYNMEERQPEIIYIHNPYDDCNMITRVDERYYSRNLKNNTKMLVYIPYCITGSVDNVKDFEIYATLACIKNADRVITQSEGDKRLYVNCGADGNKILSLGSPKMDKVLKENAKEVVIPMEWQDKLKGKKVFLLSTGIKDLMGVEYWFSNLVNMLNDFLQDTENSLIWRPHPLTEATIEKMRPEYGEIYKKIKQSILDSSNVVLDTSKDAYAAMNISDALISDYSSIMFQYTLTKKPIFAVCDEAYFADNREYACDYRDIYLLDRNLNYSEFKEMVIRGEDPKKEERVRRLRNSMNNTDGTAGKKIHEEIKNTVINSLESYLKGR